MSSSTRITDMIDRLIRTLRCFLGRLTSILDLAESMEVQLVALRKAIGANLATGEPTNRQFSEPALVDITRGQRVQSALRLAARAGVGSIELKRRPDGGAVVRVDQGRPFKLAKKLADLLTVLASQPGSGPDGFPAYLSLEELTARLDAKSGGKLSRRALTQLLYRLRHALLDGAGLSPYLIESQRTAGVRLLVRRTSRADSVREQVKSHVSPPA